MPGTIPRDRALFLGGLELNALLHAGVLPQTVFDAGRINRSVTPIFDLNGEVLFYRAPVGRGRLRVGYADFAAFEGFGAPLLAVSHGAGWDEKALRAAATAAAEKGRRALQFDQSRFVAYSYPKVAVQFLLKGQEVLMLELHTWAVVPPQGAAQGEPPANFARWSFIDHLPASRRGEAEQSFRERNQKWEEICPADKLPEGFDPLSLRRDLFEKSFKDFLPPLVTTESREVSCFELRGQQTGVWCVAASVQMLLDYYRYHYDQTRVAAELGLGTLASPNGLPYARVNDVVTVIENLTHSALDATIDNSPAWTEFTSQIQASQPVISFIPGHSRVVTGYTATKLFIWYTFRGLLVHDPWPPTTGTVTRWENFDVMTYQYIYPTHVVLA